ncbi:hypothetical protein P9990_27150 (plasmid) [Prescottella equi]|uniref:hypothetical protein n=1 Tax=Rhodococcus hoagii TaxID=43767 RepID=UPI0025771A9A|nr:hypothetical protein [Prescottella equi]WJJ14660.1 hypothetical protein P9990_27150 [Prescottella equi]
MALAAIIALVALFAWAFGSIIARVAGGILVLEGLLRFAIGQSGAGAWITLGAGFAIWCFGHWIWAYKHKTWRSRLALNAYSLPGIRRLAPIPTNYRPRPPRKWGTPVPRSFD